MGALAMSFSRKVLWIVSLEDSDDESDFAQHADAAGIDTVCIRTDSPMFPGIIGRFHQKQKTVWAWRWPGVIPSQTGTYYALRQARKRRVWCNRHEASTSRSLSLRAIQPG